MFLKKICVAIMLVFCVNSLAFEHDINIIKNSVQGKVIFLMGYPGSGKGTQGKILEKLLAIPHVSTGELFRAEKESNSKIGRQMADFMNRGEIIPSELTFEYLRQEFAKEKYKNGFILDGYPKSLECFNFIISLCSVS